MGTLNKLTVLLLVSCMFIMHEAAEQGSADGGSQNSPGTGNSQQPSGGANGGQAGNSDGGQAGNSDGGQAGGNSNAESDAKLLAFLAACRNRCEEKCGTIPNGCEYIAGAIPVGCNGKPEECRAECPQVCLCQHACHCEQADACTDSCSLGCEGVVNEKLEKTTVKVIENPDTNLNPEGIKVVYKQSTQGLPEDE